MDPRKETKKTLPKDVSTRVVGVNNCDLLKGAIMTPAWQDAEDV